MPELTKRPVVTGRCPCGNLGHLYIAGELCRDCADVLVDYLGWIRGHSLVRGHSLPSTFDLDCIALD